MPTCIFIKKNGEQCKVGALKNSQYCFVHEPSIAEERRAGRAKGGSRRKKISCIPVEKIETEQDALLVLADTIARVRAGTLDPRVAQVINSLCSTFLKGKESTEQEKQLTKLERQLLKRGN
jgi:hypothetical protein